MADAHLEVKKIAHLARIQLTTGEEEKLGKQLDQILNYIEKLSEADIEGVEPTAHAFPLVNVTRPDVTKPSLPHEDAMKNAPAKARGLFTVPKIVE